MKQLVTLSFAIKNTKEEDVFKKLKTAQINDKTKEEFVIIRRKDLEKLKRAENGLKDLLGTIENLNNKLKALSNDIRTISES